MEKILKRVAAGDATTKDLNTLVSVAANIEGNTVCALGDAAAWPVRGFVMKFHDEFEARCIGERHAAPPNVVHSKRATAQDLAS